MALFAAPSPTRSIISSPVFFLVSVVEAALLIFFFLSSDKPCSLPTTPTTAIAITTSSESNSIATKTTKEDIDWIKSQLASNNLDGEDTSPGEGNKPRKGINVRTRDQQMEDLRNYKGISHYEDSEAKNHTALPASLHFLVEEHHSNYGEPWAGGRDVFEFLASATNLTPSDRVLEVGCGTLRVGRHFIQYLDTSHFHCLERDADSLQRAFRYEIPSNGLTYKRPLIIRGEDMDFSKFGDESFYDLIYASAVFLHVPDELVWVAIERLVKRLNPDKGRLFVSHNVKFCSRLKGEECTRRLTQLGLEYVGKQTHDSVLFNHYEIWFEFRRLKVSLS